MSKSIYFAMGFHNHQPVGNFDYVFEEAYNKAYLPFLECLERHPGIKTVLHNTGPLWDEYLKLKPQWVEKMRNLVKRSQLELLSGGYYEPILVNISDRDKIAQIKLMNKVVRRETNYKPRGMWCAERVWEPSLPRPIALSEIQYTILDESHFRSAGLGEKDLFGYYVTDEQGYAISVVPINQKLRHMIPHCKPEDVIEYLRQWADEKGERLATFADDGEKFGVWPQSHRIVWEEKWLDRLFELLEKNSDWIKMTTISEYMDKYPPMGRIYLPTASYSEMGAWALPTDESRRFLKAMDELKAMDKWNEYQNHCKGGFWRNFLVKYPEANRIQKKALYVSEKIQRMITRDKTDAEIELYKGQCNCAYWHGWFGGIYLPHLRHAVQSSLIRAEQLADDEIHKGNPYKEIEQLDINRDLANEVLINTTYLQLCFSPHQGGTLYELDYKPTALNLCDTIARREEVYHDRIRQLKGEQFTTEGKMEAKEKDLDKLLVYDPYPRFSFIDHFLHEDETLANFSVGKHAEQGDFIDKSYEVFTSTKDDMAVLTLSRKGYVTADKNRYAVEIEKTFLVPEEKKEFSVQYWIINNADDPLEMLFAPEINLSFQSKDVETNYVMAEHNEEQDGKPFRRTERTAFTEPRAYEKIENITLRDGNRRYQAVVSMGQEADVWTFPIETVNNSEGGYEKVFQSVVVVPHFKLNLEPGDFWDNTLHIRIEEITTYEHEKTEEVDMEQLNA